MIHGALRLALEALEPLVALSIEPEDLAGIYKALTAIKQALEQPEQEPVAYQKDAVFEASIEFIGTLTGMKPPPIEIAPPETFKPFRDFTEKVCSIFTFPPKRAPLTETTIRTIRRDIAGTLDVQYVAFARAIEAAHGIKGEA